MHRRQFLRAAGCVTIGFTMGGPVFSYGSPVQQQLPGSLRNHPRINAWLEILDTGQVRIFTGKLELGQGIRTAIAQVAAEELDLDMQQVEVVLADTSRTPNEGYTSGSASVENSAMSVRYASAYARRKLLELAAEKWNVPIDQLHMNNGIITGPGNRSISFADLLQGRQLSDEVKLPVTLKSKEQYRWVGKPVLRDDIGRMVRGEPVYVQDLRFPGMVHARMVRPPAYGAQLRTFNEQEALKKIPGILKIVRKENFLGIITANEYEAVKAQRALQSLVTWTEGTPLPEGNVTQYIKSLPASTEKVLQKGSMDGTAPWITATYSKPYIMHASMGPSCAVAIYDKDQLHIWSHTQGVFPLRRTLSRMLNMPEGKIQITGVPGSGCYGHNGADDAAADAAVLALEYPGKHVRLQWSREEEHGWEPYGSAMIMELAAQLGPGGKISAWKYNLWSDTHSTRPAGAPQNLLAYQYMQQTPQQPERGFTAGAYRNAEPYYDIDNVTIQAHFFNGPVRVSALRGLGAYANIFAIESFMDELAAKAGTDPFTFRLMHLTDERARAVLEKLRDMIKDVPTAPGTGIGIGFSCYKNAASYCAVAALVKTNKAVTDLTVQKMWAVIDAGETINPDGLKNQTEGGMIQSASWTVQEQVRFNKQHITSVNWNSYPIFRFPQAPETEVAVIDRPNESVLGAGEAAQGPAAAAIANAVYKASGKRIRDLPLLRGQGG